jgi:hypothetical protein
MGELTGVEPLLIELKIKIKSLAEESRIIRKEERKCKFLSRRESLKAHRTGVVRNEQRLSLLAYAFLKGRPFSSVESQKANKKEISIPHLHGIIKRFSGFLVKPPSHGTVQEWINAKEETAN